VNQVSQEALNAFRHTQTLRPCLTWRRTENQTPPPVSTLECFRETPAFPIAFLGRGIPARI
jgi:hypothetical protein